MGLPLVLDSDDSSAPATGIRVREMAHARLLALYIGTGLFFLLLPGTFLGVWNLIQVSGRHSISLVSPAWLQAHGHAQIFGWVATFILGIGFYSIPLVNAGARPSLTAARACWLLWTCGVTMRWAANVYGWHWRFLLPLSAVVEVIAFAIFFRAVSQPRAAGMAARLDPWIRVVIAGAIGFALTLGTNLVLSSYVAWRGESPAFPHALNERFLVLTTWGFLAPFVWGFSSKWLPVLLGLRQTRSKGVLLGLALNSAGVILMIAGWRSLTEMLFVVAAVLVAVNLRLFEPSQHPPKTRGVHPTFPLFVRSAYAWLIIAAALGFVAVHLDVSGGIWGASRHAFTVGFVSVMVFSIGQRVLPAFAAMGPLWSPRLMFIGLLMLTTGCLLRVGSEIVAYQHGVAWAWAVLPISAFVELAAVTLFAFNMAATFIMAPEPIVVASIADRSDEVSVSRGRES
jgi:hypothetical protein